MDQDCFCMVVLGTLLPKDHSGPAVGVILLVVQGSMLPSDLGKFSHRAQHSTAM